MRCSALPAAVSGALQRGFALPLDTEVTEDDKSAVLAPVMGVQLDERHENWVVTGVPLSIRSTPLELGRKCLRGLRPFLRAVYPSS